MGTHITYRLFKLHVTYSQYWKDELMIVK